MTESITFSWGLLVFPLAVFSYFELLRWMDRRLVKNRRFTLTEILSNYARYQGISEYDVFHRASGTWSISRYQVDADFNGYLQTLIMPYYVRDFIRKLDTKTVRACSKPNPNYNPLER